MDASTAPRFFHVPADEVMSSQPCRCPLMPGLTLDGLAVTEGEQYYVILSLQGVARFYVGPDSATVERRAGILAAALRRRGLDLDHAQLVGRWVEAVWEATLDELVTELTRRWEWSA